jgi:ATP-dependent DNA helicase RecG
LKTIVLEDIRKEVVAFANCNGEGAVVGVDDPDEAMLQVSNMVRDGIKPDVPMFSCTRTEKR